MKNNNVLFGADFLCKIIKDQHRVLYEQSLQLQGVKSSNYQNLVNIFFIINPKCAVTYVVELEAM